MNAIILICGVFLLSLPFAAPAENKMYGIYSSMRNVEGEISGFEMLILHNGKPGEVL